MVYLLHLFINLSTDGHLGCQSVLRPFLLSTPPGSLAIKGVSTQFSFSCPCPHCKPVSLYLTPRIILPKLKFWLHYFLKPRYLLLSLFLTLMLFLTYWTSCPSFPFYVYAFISKMEYVRYLIYLYCNILLSFLCKYILFQRAIP